MINKENKSQPLQSTLAELQKAFDEWDALTPDHAELAEAQQKQLQAEQATQATHADIRKKTQEILKKLNEQIKDLGL